MTVTIKKTQEVTTQVDLPAYFTTLSGWYYMTLPNDEILHVTENSAAVGNADSVLKYVIGHIKPCTQDAFIAAYCEAINRIAQASGIEHLPLIIEGGAYAD